MVIETTIELKPLYSTFADDPEKSVRVETFVAELPDLLAKMTDCTEKGDWAQLGELAHRLTVAGKRHGFPEMIPFAQRLERVVSQNDSQEVLLRVAEDVVHLCRRIRKGADESHPRLHA